MSMEKKEKVSIIIPVYNVEKYFSKCIDSIIGQSYENLEIILINDGSTDKSGEIADEYALKDSRIKVIHKKNEGVSVARNTGIEVATGTYVCFVDSDDYVMEDCVQYLVNMIENSNADISLTTEMFGNFNLVQTKNINEKTVSAEEATTMILLYDIPIGVYCKLFRREFLQKKNIKFNQKLFIGEGFNFNVDAFQRANSVVVGSRKIYYYRRDNETSATTKFSIEKWKNGIEAVKMIKKNFLINTPKVNKAWEFAFWRTCSDVYDIIVLAKVEKKYSKFYLDIKNITKKRASVAFFVPTAKQQKIRALVFMIYPKLIPMLMLRRRRKYNITVSN